jgi:hypothetical protein
MLKKFAIRIEFGVECQTCLEFCDVRTLKILAIKHFLIERYSIPSPILAAVPNSKTGLRKGRFRAIERRKHIMR